MKRLFLIAHENWAKWGPLYSQYNNLKTGRFHKLKLITHNNRALINQYHKVTFYLAPLMPSFSVKSNKSGYLTTFKSREKL